MLSNRLSTFLGTGVVIVLLSAPSSVFGGQSATPELQRLYDEHNWSALHVAIRHRKAPLFYRAAVEAAYNDLKPAVKHLDGVIREAPRSDNAYESHGMLTDLYFRNGMYREAFAQLTAMHTARPFAEDVRATIPLLRALSREPDQRVVSRTTSTLSMHMEQGNMFVPVTLDGFPSNYILDTGANFSLMSEGDAKRLGLHTSTADAKVSDSSGVGIGMNVAKAKDLYIRGLHLRNVAFGVIPDSQEPFVELPQGQRALLGIPVLLAMRALRWEPSGSFRLVHPHPASHFNKANVSFVGMFPAVQVQYQQKLLTFSLDTGAISTDLEPHFAQMFPQVLKDEGKNDFHKLTGVGGTVSYDAVTLPMVKLSVGGLNVTLQPATVLMKASSASSSWADGNLGMDLLNQAHSVTLDFKAMTLSLN